MHLGFSTMNTHKNIQPTELGPLLEERGYESLWFGEHSQIPTARNSPHPREAVMPEPYKNMMDPYISLTAAACVTTKLKLGTSISLLLERELFSQAKTLMTLDRISNGRLLVGTGVGWNEEQFNNASNLPWKRRFSAMKETVAATRTLWTDEEPEFHGDIINFDPVWCSPKPIQQPGPPILYGGVGPLGLKHTVDWADGWMPVSASLEDIPKAIADFNEQLKQAGRDPDTFDITMIIMEKPAIDRLKLFRDLGVKRAILGGSHENWDNSDMLRDLIDKFAEFIPQLA
jgi:probable F420-dependent oxidoreductase